MDEDWSGSEGFLEIVETGLARGGPLERDSFAKEIHHRTSDLGVVLDESTVEVGKP